MTKATDLIAAERERQITEEGYTAEQDNGHADELAFVGSLYADAASGTIFRGEAGELAVSPIFPWHPAYWKPTGDPVRDLVKAGALIAAAIDSLLDES